MGDTSPTWNLYARNWASALHQSGGGSQDIAYRTTAQYNARDDSVSIYYFGTEAVRHMRCGTIIVRVGGHPSKTIKHRINRCIPERYRIVQNRGAWVVLDKQLGTTRSFHEALVLHGEPLTQDDLDRLLDDGAKVFRGQTLRGLSLRGRMLSGCDFRGADMRDCDMRQANLRDADLRGADMRGARTTRAKLPKAWQQQAVTA